MTAQDNAPINLHRAPHGDYRFDDDGVGYRVVRLTDGGAPSVVIWEVRREADGSYVRSFTTLSDLRRMWRKP